MLTAHHHQALPDEGSKATAPDRDRASIVRDGIFAVDAEFDPPRMTLALAGELDLAGAPSLQREIESLPWPHLAELVFDLAELTFMDSSGLAVLIRASQRAATAGLRFSVVHIAAQPRQLFAIVGVIDTLNAEC